MTYASYENLNKIVKNIREKTDFVPDAAVILGSGLGDFAKKIKPVCVLPYSDIEGFPVSTVSGHEGQFIFGYIGETAVAVMQGRVHYYEGYDITQVVLPVRVLGMMGAKKLVITNAAGGINSAMSAGDFMIIRDHISSFVPSPLVGENIDELGTRFPDMSHIYDKDLRKRANELACEMGIDIKNGVYVQTSGPAYETPAEIQMFKALGADAVGMSTACEATAAVHMGIRVFGISCISNLAAGISPRPLSHSEIQETASRVGAVFERFLFRFICELKDL